MIQIVETTNEFQNFKEEYDRCAKSVVIPIYADKLLHPVVNTLSLLYVDTFDKEYVLTFDHNDAHSLDYDLLEDLKNDAPKFTPDKKSLIQTVDLGNAVDISLLYWFVHNSAPNFTTSVPLFRQLLGDHRRISNINRYTPLLKLAEKCSEVSLKMKRLIAKYEHILAINPFKRYNEYVIPAFSKLEMPGLRVDEEQFRRTFPDKEERPTNGYLYTDYNLFTSTGRPSNARNKINYAALNGETQEKSAFISRFGDDGMLVLFDYDAFHLRLIGKLVRYELPNESFHAYLGRKFFETNELTEEQYEESKAISFHLLYGSIIEEALEIEFFRRTQTLIDRVWKVYEEHNLLQTPKFGRQINGKHIRRVTPNKALNYLLQSTETEYNVTVINRIHDLLKDYNTELVLYTYDSFLFDFSKDDGLELLTEIERELERGGMLTKSYVGDNYSEMELVTK